MILYISDVQCGRRVVSLKYPLEQQRVLFRICTISQKNDKIEISKKEDKKDE